MSAKLICKPCNSETKHPSKAAAQQLARTHNTMQHGGKPVAKAA